MIKSEVIYCPYVPVQVSLTPEQAAAKMKKNRAGKTYAKVKLSHPDAHYRCKRGEVLETVKTDHGNKYKLHIDVLNTCSENGYMTLLGVMSTGYKDVWFYENDLKDFESYDDNGDYTETSNVI